LKALLYLTALLPGSALAQIPDRPVRDINANGWFMYFGDHPVKGRWEAHVEGQWRRHDVVNNWQQLLLRPGVNYQINEQLTLTGGYAFIETHRYGGYAAPFNTIEHRIWQQALVLQRGGRVRLQHRFRPEQRWIRPSGNNWDNEQWRYQNRFRYLGKATVPLQGRWFGAFYDEIFLNIAPNIGARVFDQNRAYAAVGRRLGRHSSVEVGYLHQLVAQRNGLVTEHNHTLQFAVFSRIPFGR
jgi:hypothetical protein